MQLDVATDANFNSPIDPATREITDSTRIRGDMETVNDLADAKLMILAHQGRPGDSDFVTPERRSHHSGCGKVSHC